MLLFTIGVSEANEEQRNAKDFHSIRAHEVILSNMRISGKMNTNKNVYKIIRKNHAFLYAPILKWGWCF